MRKFGLIGYPLSHSFSKKYFSEKFEKERIADATYDLYEINDIKFLPDIIYDNPELIGFNVTIPYKQEVLQYLDEISSEAERIGAVNVVKIINGKLKGYNSDYIGFKKSLENFLENSFKIKLALVLGTGGASKAVQTVLEDMNIDLRVVSRTKAGEVLVYDDINLSLINDFKLVINTTPLGMSPNVDSSPQLPYEAVGKDHFFYDLVYNPVETLFMKTAEKHGAKVKNGLEMLHLQAEASWEIWNS